MRIVIIGEFSSFAKNLSDGFRKIGHDCFVFSWDDGFKHIKQHPDYSYDICTDKFKKYGGIIQRFLLFLSYLKLRRFVNEMAKKEKFDVALLMNYSFIKEKGFFYYPFFTPKMIFSLLKNPNNVYVLAAGGDVPYIDYWSKQQWKNIESINIKKGYLLSKRKIRHHNMCKKIVSKVIPVMYDYAEAWRQSEYSKDCIICPTIPLPVDCSKYKVHNEIGDKIVVYHGISRPKDKGTKYIQAGMENLQKAYPDKVECKVCGGLPFDEYIEVLQKTNILMDQTYSGSTGLNGIYAMAMGKVLFSGNVPQNSIEFKYPNIPIVNIDPDSEQIFRALEDIILNPTLIKKLSEQSRLYVEKVHDSMAVAKKYIEIFNNYNEQV